MPQRLNKEAPATTIAESNRPVRSTNKPVTIGAQIPAAFATVFWQPITRPITPWGAMI